MQRKGQIASLVTSTLNSTTSYDAFRTATGHYPLIMGWDYVPQADDPVSYAGATARLKAHYDAGGLLSTQSHLKNFITGRQWYDRSKTDFSCVTQLKRGGSAYAAWTAWLDAFADFCLNGIGGRPIIWRMFPESNGWFDYADIAIASMTTTGSTVTVNTVAAHGLSAGQWIQMVGATPAAVNGSQYVNNIVSSTSFKYDAPGAITVQGTTCYPCSGFWWAGRDRRADLMQVIRETFEYLTVTKGVHNILYCINMYPFDGTLFPSSYPQGSDAFGTFDYPGWWPGDQFVDIMTSDYYDRSASIAGVSMNKQTLFDTSKMQQSFSNAIGKPFGWFELGFDYAGKQKANFWTNDVLVPMKSNMSKTCIFGLWDQNYIPAPGDAAYASFQEAMADPVMIHL